MVRRSFDSFLSLLVMAAGKALFVLLTANFYGPEGQGIVTLGVTVAVTGALFLGVGTDLANTYLVGADPSRVASLRRSSFAITAAALGVSAFLIPWVYEAFRGNVFVGFPPVGQIALVLLIPLQILHLQSQGLLVGLSDFRGLALANLLQFGVVLLGLVAVWSVGWQAVAVLFVWALGLAAKIGYCLFLLPRSDAQRPSLSKALTEQVKHGIRMMFGSLANLLNFRLDTYFIAYFLTTRELGLYAVAATIAEATLYLPKAIGQVVFSWAAAKSRPGESRLEMSKIRYFFLGGTYSSLATVLLVQLLLAPLVALLFEDFSRSVPAARILLLAVFFYGIGLVAMNLLFGLGDPHSNTRAGLTAAVVNATVNLLAIPKFGIAGAAVASLLSYVAFCLLNLIAVKARLAHSIRLRHLLIPDADATRRFLGLVRSAMDALRRVSRR